MRLWDAAIDTGILDIKISDNPSAGIFELAVEIRSFLREEQVRYGDHPNAIRSLVELLSFTPVSIGNSEAFASAILELGLLILGAKPIRGEGDKEDFLFDSPLRKIANEIEKDSWSYVAASGTYSSIYSALLAMLLHDMTVARWLHHLTEFFENEHFARRFQGQFILPNSSLLARVYRGQRRDWLPIPSAFRDNDGTQLKPAEILGRTIHRTLGQFKFAYALAGLFEKIPSPAALIAVQQHYGFPTPLLDFSHRMEVAAFFASHRAKAGETGVLYRFHTAHLYFRKLLAQLMFDDKGKYPLKPVAVKWAGIATEAAKSIRMVDAPDVERIRRQSALFVDGFRLDSARTFLQPIFFRQCEGVAYVNEARNITKSYLLPDDDPIRKRLHERGLLT